MVRLDRLPGTRVDAPFPHLVGEGVLDESARDALSADFPDPRRPGFFPEETLACGPAVKALCAELRTPGCPPSLARGSAWTCATVRR